jgi:hypothetical protein
MCALDAAVTVEVVSHHHWQQHLSPFGAYDYHSPGRMPQNVSRTSHENESRKVSEAGVRADALENSGSTSTSLSPGVQMKVFI